MCYNFFTKERDIMAVKLRLKRMGKKQAPFYRIVAADSRSKRDGKAIEEVGYYDPTKNPAEIKIDEELTIKWLKNGAQPTDTVRSILSKQGIMKKYHERSWPDARRFGRRPAERFLFVERRCYIEVFQNAGHGERLYIHQLLQGKRESMLAA